MASFREIQRATLSSLRAAERNGLPDFLKAYAAQLYSKALRFYNEESSFPGGKEQRRRWAFDLMNRASGLAHEWIHRDRIEAFYLDKFPSEKRATKVVKSS